MRASENDVRAAAAYLDLPDRLVRAAVSYYAEFGEEVDAYAATADAHAERERVRWQREQDLLA